ncbi:MAG: hypothetical protein OHK0048_13780 [Rhodoferax sp.]
MLYKTVIQSTLLCASLVGASLAWAGADTPEIKELLQASGCLSCHSVEEKIVGPAFKSVAAKYASDADAVDNLMQSIRNGSRGKWGRTPMPSHASLPAEDIKALATWVMSHKP